MINAFCKMCITICGRFRLNEGGVVGYGNRMKAKYTVNWGVQIAGMIFQTRSSINTIYILITICHIYRFFPLLYLRDILLHFVSFSYLQFHLHLIQAYLKDSDYKQ